MERPATQTSEAGAGVFVFIAGRAQAAKSEAGLVERLPRPKQAGLDPHTGHRWRTSRTGMSPAKGTRGTLAELHIDRQLGPALGAATPYTNSSICGMLSLLAITSISPADWDKVGMGRG